MIQNDMTREYSLEDIIKKGPSNELILDNLNMFVNFEGFTIPQMNILFEKYRGVIIESCLKIKLSDELLRHYIYRPKYLSLKLYGTIDLWQLILWINDLTSATQFDKSIIYVFDPERIDILERIISIEKNRLRQNHENPEEIYITK